MRFSEINDGIIQIDITSLSDKRKWEARKVIYKAFDSLNKRPKVRI